MKRHIFCAIVFFFSLPAYSQSNLEKVDCESNALRKWRQEEDICRAMTNYKMGESLSKVAECHEKSAKVYIKSSCMPSLAMVVNNFSILWQQLKIINQQYAQKQISYDRAGSQSVMLLQTLKEQQDDYYHMLQTEIKIIRADEAERSSRRFLNLALGGLEIVAKNGQPLNPTNMTYILNGRIYRCSTVGNITNCM